MMVRTLLLLLMAAITSFANAMELNGAGATFPALVYQKWADNYTAYKALKVNYQAVGSGEGIKRIKAGEVDFGGTDMPLAQDDLDLNELIQFPMLMGAITPVFHLPGIYIAQLKLDGDLLASIFMGKITKWNDPRIVAMNPSLQGRLPDMLITVVHRQDKSGTTFNFTNYLSKVSPEWRHSLGDGLEIKWPTGIAAKGNAGVSEKIKEIEGSIGYVEYSYAMENHLDYVLLKNKEGNFVRPNAGSTQAAASGVQWSASNGFYQILTDASGDMSWPITAATFILIRRDMKDADQLKRVLKMMDYNYRTGELTAMYYDFVVLPKNLIDQVRQSWKALRDRGGKPVWE